MSKLGDRIKQRRVEMKLSQQELADSLKIKRQSVQAWESGKSEPANRRLIKLANLLQINHEWLVTGEKSEQFLTNRVLVPLVYLGENNPMGKNIPLPRLFEEEIDPSLHKKITVIKVTDNTNNTYNKGDIIIIDTTQQIVIDGEYSFSYNDNPDFHIIKPMHRVDSKNFIVEISNHTTQTYPLTTAEIIIHGKVIKTWRTN